MSDPYAFYYAQLAGGNPDTTPGTPHAGFYRNRRRWTIDNPAPTVGGPRKKTFTEHDAVAIWSDDDGWHCVITRPDREHRYLTDVDAIDAVFSRCCRDALPYDEYLKLTVHQEEAA